MLYQIDIENNGREIHEGTAESAVAVVKRQMYVSHYTEAHMVQRLKSGGVAVCSYGFKSAEIRQIPA